MNTIKATIYSQQTRKYQPKSNKETEKIMSCLKLERCKLDVIGKVIRSDP